mgnify:CR=1 FL=1
MGKPGSGKIISLSSLPNNNAEIKITGLPPGVIKTFSGLIFALYLLNTNSEIDSRNSGIPFDGV